MRPILVTDGCERGIALGLALLMTLAAIIVIPQAIGAEVQSFRIHAELGHYGWAAFRVNITPDTDLSFGNRVAYCLGEGENATLSLGYSDWRILDGIPHIAFLSAGDYGGAVGGIPDDPWFTPFAQAEIMGEEFTAPTRTIDNPCGVLGSGNVCHDYVCRPPANHTITFVVNVMGGNGSADFNGDWTRGVISYDLSVGIGHTFTKNDLQTGAHVDATPILNAGSAGALAGARFATRGNSIGFLNTGDSGPGITLSSCTRNGEPCPTTGKFVNAADLYQKDPANFDYELTLSARAHEVPSYMISIIDLGDLSYLM